MQIKHSVRTLTLASMLAFSIMSPLAAHASAAPNDGGSPSASVPGDCTADQAYQSTGGTNYKTGENIAQNTTLYAVDPAGNVNKNAKYKCVDGKIVVALTIQPTRIRPVAPPIGAVYVP